MDKNEFLDYFQNFLSGNICQMQKRSFCSPTYAHFIMTKRSHSVRRTAIAWHSLSFKRHYAVYLLSSQGKEATLYRLRAGDICTLSASCMLSAITFDVQIDAETDCELLLLPAPVFPD